MVGALDRGLDRIPGCCEGNARVFRGGNGGAS